MNDERLEDVLAKELAAYQEQLERTGPEAHSALPPGDGHSLPGDGHSLPEDLQQELAEQKRCLDLLHAMRKPTPRRGKPAYRHERIVDAPATERFQRLDELGSGGFGVVWRARDPVTGRIVALKMPRPEVLASPELRKRFEQEAEAAARLDHPNIVPILEAGADGIVPYIASTYYEGPTLAQWLAKHPVPVPPRQAALVALQLAKALTHAHERGVLHRDVKPSNVLLAPLDGGEQRELPFEPKLMDFGLAKLGERDQELTRTGAMLGTLKYMAPEQAAGRAKEITAATDVYGLGVVLYEMLAGKPPFNAESDWLTLRQVLEDEPRSVSSIRRDVPRDLAVIVQKCLSKLPGQRYRTARELAEDLERYLAGKAILARPVPLLERLAKWCRRNPAWAALMAVVTLALVAGITFLSYSNVRISAALESEQTIRGELAASLASEKASREQLALRLYASDMRRADEANDRDNVMLAQQLLEPYATAQGANDYREFAWRYLWGRLPHKRPFIEQQPAAIYSIALSADRKWLATAGADHYVRVWDTATRQEVCALPCGQTEINEVTFSPDGKLLAAGCESARICVWETERWTLRHDLEIGGVITADADRGADRFNTVSLQSNGMIVAAGPAVRGDDDALVYRFKPNGQPDTSFGKDGIVVCLDSKGPDSITSMVVEQEGRMVVAGYQNNDNYVIKRFEPNGSLDLRFGEGGTTSIDLGTPDDIPMAITRTTDNKYLLAGRTRQNNYYDVAVVCLTSDGRLDPDFGNNGIQITQVSPFGDKASAISVLPDGRFVVAGSRTLKDGDRRPEDIFVLCYHADGTLDERFGDRGCAALASAELDEQAHSMTLQGDGKIIVAGQCIVDGATRMFAARLNPDGIPDRGFGADGTFIADADLPNSVANAVTVQADGNILLVGGAGPPDQRCFALVRLTPEGSLDETFGQGGRVVKQIGNGSELSSVSLDSDGRIVVAGFARCGGTSLEAENFAVARLLPDGRFDRSFTTNGAQGVVFTPDSSRLLSYAHQCIRVWDMHSGAVVQETYAPAQSLVDIDLSLDGKYLLTAAESWLWAWKLDSFQSPCDEHRYNQGIGTLAALATPETVLVALRTGPLVVWDYVKHEERAVFKHRKRNRARNLRLSDDGTLVSIVFDNKVVVHRTADWSELSDVVTHSRIYDVAQLAREQSMLTSSSDGAVLQWPLRVDEGATIEMADAARVIHSAEESITAIAFSPEDRLVACGHKDGSLFVVESSSGRMLHRSDGEGVQVNGLGFANSNRLFIGYASGKIVGIDLNDGKILNTVAIGQPIGRLGLSPDGSRFAVSLDEVRTVEVRAWPSGQLLATCNHRDELADLKFTPDGKSLILGGAANLDVFDVATGRRIGGEMQAGHAYDSVAVLRDGIHILVAEMDKGFVLRQLSSGRPIRQLLSDADVRRVAVTTNGRNAALVTVNNEIQIWDLKTWEMLMSFALEVEADVSHLCFSNDGKKLFATCGSDLYLWEAP